MAEHDDQSGAIARCCELHAADLRGRDDIAGDADDEQIAETLIEDDLRGHARIRTAQDDGERFLARRDLVTTALARQRVLIAFARNETRIAFPQSFECCLRRHHRCPFPSWLLPLASSVRAIAGAS
jgi:hypothetical protein